MPPNAHRESLGFRRADRSMRDGPLPVAWSAPERPGALAAYVGLYLEQEGKAEALVRDVGAFARFAEVMAFAHGSVLNITAVARECQVSRGTVQAHVELLEDLLLGFRTPVFTRRAKRQLVDRLKFYYFDSGVCQSVRPRVR